MDLNSLDWRNADADKVCILEREYVDQLHRTDWLYEQLEGKAQRVLTIVVPLGSAAFVLAAAQGHNLPTGLEQGLWFAVAMLFASGVLAAMATRLRDYVATAGLLPRTTGQFEELDGWLAERSEDAIKRYRIMRIKKMAGAITTNKRSNHRKTRLVKWALRIELAVLPVAYLASCIPVPFL